MAPPPHDNASAYPGVPGVGEIVAGKYRVEKVIGVGGMGVVLAAKHAQLGQRVAIKFLMPEAARQEEAIGRFLREARAAASIDSEHVARVIDVSTAPSGTPFMVMEHLSGMDLGALLRTHGPRPQAEAIEYVLQAAEAIAQAHAVGIVHRDLKPSNLFLVRRPDGVPLVKVLDFGISKITSPEHEDQHLTVTTMSYGTPIYMSPEQVRSLKNVDHRTDIWALGVILHELLSGKLPFAGETLTALCAAIASDPPIPLRAHLPSAPVELEQVILRCLEKPVDARFGSIGELAAALVPIVGDTAREHADRIQKIASGQFAPSLGLLEPVLPPGDPNQLTASAWGRTRAKNRSGRAVMIASGVTIAMGAAALIFVVVGSSSSAPASSASITAPAASASIAASNAPPLPSPPAIAPSATPPASASALPPKDASPRKRPPRQQDNVDALRDRR